MAFDYKACAIPTAYCGKSDVIPQKSDEDGYFYFARGTPYECLQKGIGMGAAIERDKKIGSRSLQKIRYVGPKYEAAFIEEGVDNLDDLIKYPKSLLKSLLSKIYQKKVGMDLKAYNSTLLYLHKNGATNLPKCEIIKKDK